MRKSVTRYRELLKEHGHGPKRATWVFWLFIDRDHDVAVREGRDITRAYTTLFARRLIPELLAGRSEMQTNGATEDPFQQFLDFAQAMPDELEQRAVVGTPADCRRRLRELDDEFDLDQVAFYFHAGGRDPQCARDGLELFAHEVMPEFAQGGLSLFGSPWAAVALQRGLLPLHASAVSRAGAVHAFSGASGGGQSTLAAALGRHGLPFFADDLLLLDPASFGEGCLCLPQCQPEAVPRHAGADGGGPAGAGVDVPPAEVGTAVRAGRGALGRRPHRGDRRVGCEG